jgi:hypothetical protein
MSLNKIGLHQSILEYVLNFDPPHFRLLGHGPWKARVITPAFTKPFGRTIVKLNIQNLAELILLKQT